MFVLKNTVKSVTYENVGHSRPELSLIFGFDNEYI